MALIEYLKPLILAAGLLFILVGLHILTEENTTYATQLDQLYIVCLWTFYLYLFILFLSVLVGGLQALAGLKWGWKK